MGNYATNAELIARFEDAESVALLIGDEKTLVPDQTVLTELIVGAEGTVDSYLGTRYSVPVDVSGSTVLEGKLRSITLDLAVRHTEAYKGRATDAALLQHEEAIEWLTNISKGLIVLPTPDTPEATTSREPDASWGDGATKSERETSNRIMSRDSFRRL